MTKMSLYSLDNPLVRENHICSSHVALINSDGTLTRTGDAAVGCITNRAIVSAFAASLNIPLGTVKGLLGGIVDMNQFQNSPDVQRLLQFAGSLAR
jgi:hypothetical protein